MAIADFASPVDHPIRLSGSFGELRTNHFHAGIDIKSKNGRSGDPVYSIDEGCVSRVKIQAAGYGQAVYIDHPNGLTSVYAHLKDLDERIEDYVRSQQWTQQSFEVDLYPDSCSIKYGKREQIGTMGNTGYSFGPHLHFELRNTRTERVVNPTMYDFMILDNIAPRMRNLKIYTLDDALRTVDDKVVPLRRHRGIYRTGNDTLEVAAWRVGFGLDMLDQMNGTRNRNDIYSLKLFVDDALSYTFQLDSISFDEMAYINAHKDVGAYKKYRWRVHKAYVLPGNLLRNYAPGSNGVVELYADRKQKIRLVAKDHKGNSSEARFWIKRKTDMPGYPPSVHDYTIRYDQPNVIRENGARLDIPANAVYVNRPIKLDIIEDSSKDIFSNVLFLDGGQVPFHKPVEIWLAARNIDPDLVDKYYVSDCSGSGDINLGGKWSEHGLQTKTRSGGQFAIKLDTIPPSIHIIQFPSVMRRGSRIKFVSKENLPTGGLAGKIKYTGRIDGEWILIEYDYKNDLLSATIDMDLDPGMHTFELEVSDYNQNTNTWTKEFKWVH